MLVLVCVVAAARASLLDADLQLLPSSITHAHNTTTLLNTSLSILSARELSTSIFDASSLSNPQAQVSSLLYNPVDKLADDLRNNLQHNNDDYTERDGRRRIMGQLASPAVPWPLPPEARQAPDDTLAAKILKDSPPRGHPDHFKFPSADTMKPFNWLMIDNPPAVPSPRVHPSHKTRSPHDLSGPKSKKFYKLQELKNFVQSNKDLVSQYVNERKEFLAKNNVIAALVTWHDNARTPQPLLNLNVNRTQPARKRVKEIREKFNDDKGLWLGVTGDPTAASVASLTPAQPTPVQQRNPLFFTPHMKKRRNRWWNPRASRDRKMVRSMRYGTEIKPQYDMAPAKGGRADHLRLKGKLCHRSVLIPEGPKYDSKGKVYLTQFNSSKYGNYRHTKKPRVILPRCCNCCRKSVLGCE